MLACKIIVLPLIKNLKYNYGLIKKKEKNYQRKNTLIVWEIRGELKVLIWF
jgi:hypothetical protein